GRVEEAALFQVAQQPGDWEVGPVAGGFEFGGEIRVVVPDLLVDVELHEAHAALDEPAGDPAAPAGRIGRPPGRALQIERRLRFARQVEGVGRGELHAGGEFVASDSRVEVRLAGPGGAVQVIEFRNQVAFGIHHGGGALDVGLEVQERRASRAKARAL